MFSHDFDQPILPGKQRMDLSHRIFEIRIFISSKVIFCETGLRGCPESKILKFCREKWKRGKKNKQKRKEKDKIEVYNDHSSKLAARNISST